ncbi:MAG TPA: acyloxyacyl hydrolase [Deferrimonas sp.]
MNKRVGPIEVLGDGRNYLDVGAGIFNWRNNLEKRSLAGRVELRIGKKFVFVGPAMGIYRRGNSINLGGPLEFRESLEIAYRFTDRCRAGVSVAHISNAHLYMDNPGQQDFLISSSIGF